jgi:glucosamine--fructose-6-phosphate aminotransferase (isomerizing)
VAGAAIAEAFSRYLKGVQINIQAKTSSELSGFFLEENLSHALVIAVTQSGTTTDTNRAVAMAKERGAHLIAIVNRRQSDITHVADGVFYTSDGRDIEMSVASTKAFYSQIVAGYVLALYFAQIFGVMSDDLIARELLNLEDVPDKMNSVIAIKEKIRNSAWDIVKKKKYWAIVGSGPNKVAADEIRIKLSELCYKTISSDIVENKKHIDLSAEPLIIVCAAGNPEPVVEDIVKDVAIFKAHSAGVVVITDEGETRFNDIADSVISVPGSTYPASVILNTLVGHIWGYYAACSINEDGDFFRSFRNKLSQKMGELDKKDDLIFDRIADAGLHKLVEEFSSDFRSRRNRGLFSSMSVDVASDITLLLKYVAGKLPLEDFWEEFKEKRTSSSPLDMLDVCLGRTIDELSRPVDAIRHQAKTVTVGTSRKGEIPRGILFDLLGRLGFSLENLTSKEGFTARRLQGTISGTKGYTLYNIENLDDEGKPRDVSSISIEKKGGIALEMKSRVGKHTLLKGTKKSIVSTGDIYAGLGKFDKAPIVIVPLMGEDHSIKNILLVHVSFKEDLRVSEKKAVLGGKFNNIRDLINECDFSWDDNYLEGLPIEFLLGESADVISSRIMKFLKEN